MIYNYAVVLEDPSHSFLDQPKFELSIRNSSNVIVNQQCGFYSVRSGANIPGFQTYATIGQTIRWKDWTTVGVDLSPYIGQSLKIEFETHDCGLGAHFGYAYLVAQCTKAEIETEFCPSSNVVTLTAPAGFSYQWNDSLASTGQSINVLNPNVGDQYSVTLTSVTGCQVTLNTTLTPNTIIPDAYIPDTVCTNELFLVSDSSTSINSIIDSWLWDFDDGSPLDTNSSIFHHYSSSGNYLVNLIIGNDKGCFDTIKHNIHVLQSPTASFSVNEDCLRDTSQFLTSSTGINGLKYQWIFHDGSSSNAPNPNFYNGAPGQHTAILVLTDSINGCTDTATVQYNVTTTPTANINLPDSICISDQEIIINNYVQSDSAFVASFYINGSEDSIVNPRLLGGGVHQVNIVMSFLNGCDTSFSNDIYVIEPSNSNSIVADSTCLNDPINLTSQSSFNFGTINNYIWNWGDGTVDTLSLSTFSHTYATPGYYSGFIIALSDFGCTDTTHFNFFIDSIPAVNFGVTNACTGQSIQFNNLTTHGDSLLFEWDFGSGQNSQDENPQYSYNSPGYYDVRLAITSYTLGCVDSIEKTIYINETPELMDDTISGYCLNEGPMDLSQILMTTVPSSFIFSGLGINSGFFIPRNAGVGYNLVSVTMISDSGCSNQQDLYIKIDSLPTASVSTIPDLCVNGSSIDLSQYIIKNSFNTSYQILGTGVQGTDFNPSVAGIGTTTISFILVNSVTGCSDTIYTEILVRDPVDVSFEPYRKLCIDTEPFKPWGYNPEGGELVGQLNSHGFFNPQAAGVGLHEILYVFTDVNGCTDTATQVLDVVREGCYVHFFVPNAVTFNNDGTNDEFYIGYSGEIRDFRIFIFDRWGNVVFKSEDPGFKWDGTYQNNIVNQGVYSVRILYRENSHFDFWQERDAYKEFIQTLTILR